MSSCELSIIIPVLNAWPHTLNCLTELAAHSCDLSFEVIVIDNGSDDETAQALDPVGERLFGSLFRSVHLPENRNFGPACNLGAAMARSERLFFLNNDTLVTDNWVQPLLRGLEAGGLRGVGPLLLYADRTVQHLGTAFTVNGMSHLYRAFPADHPVVRRERKVQALTGAALLLPRALFFGAGGFFEGYRNGCEDVDLCLRLGQEGVALYCLPSSVIYHLESQTQGRKAHDRENSTLLKERCGSLISPDYHIHALRDGFVPFVTDSFELALRMKQEEERALIKRLRSAEVSVWLDVLRENPLFIAGRLLLAERAFALGDMRLAILLRSDLLALLGTEEACRDLLALEKYALDEDRAFFKDAEETLQQIRAFRDEPLRLHILMREVKKSRDRFLIALFEEKACALRRNCPT